MDDLKKQVEAIEKEIRETPYHKGTEHHIGKLRARVARLKDRMLEKQVKKGGGGGGGFAIKKFGDATVVLVGFPSVGKSTLLNALTNAKSPTAEYAFTTVTVIPGMMKYKGASIQILDVPGLIEGAASGKGRGREVLSVIRSADLLLIMAEAGKEDQFRRIENELYSNGVRINQEPPMVTVVKSLAGGIKTNFTVPQELDKETIKDVAREFSYINAEITIKERLNIDRLIDAFAKNRVWVKAVHIVNKIDKIARDRKAQGVSMALSISAIDGVGLAELKEAIWQTLELIRVFLRKADGTVDYDDPMIVRREDSLKNVLAKIGTDFANSKKSAKIWGSGARFPGQSVSLNTKVQDELEVEFV